MNAVLSSRRGAVVLTILSTLAMAMGLFAGGRASAQPQYDNVVRVDVSSFVDAGVAVSQAVFSARANAAIVATDANFPDALASSALSTTVGGPVLFTLPDSLPPQTEAELQRVLNQGDTVYVMGGPAAVSEGVVQQLMNLGFNPQRVAGPTRLETAVEAAKLIAPAGTAFLARAFGGAPGSMEDRSTGWIDSISCGGPAANTETPVLLTETERLSDSTAAALDELGITNVVICGGQGAVSEDVETALEQRNVAVTRVSGVNRAATAVAVAQEIYGYQTAAGHPYIVINGYGENYGYGLAAAPLSALQDAPLLVVNTTTPTSCQGEQEAARETLCYLASASDNNEARLSVVGSASVIADAVVEAAAETSGGDVVASPTPTATTTATATPSPTRSASPGASPSASPGASPSASPGASPTPPPGSVTGAPELLSVTDLGTGPTVTENNQPVETRRLRFTFDETLLATAPVVKERFRLYTTAADKVEAVRAQRDANAPSTVLADFRASQYRSATTAAVAYAAVQDDDAILNPEASFGLKSYAQASGTTVAPDLERVANFRQPASATNPPTTLVDFTFDDPAFTATSSGYRLVKTDSTVLECSRSETGEAAVHTVSCQTAPTGTLNPPASVQASEVARAYVLTNTVSDTEQDPATIGTEGNGNPQQAVIVTAGGTSTPDLTGVAINEQKNEATFTFDEAVNVPTEALTGANDGFRLYELDGDEVVSTTAKKGSSNNVVVASFAAGAVTKFATGASVDQGAVTSTATGNANRVDELGLQQTFQAGETAGPELRTVDRAVKGSGADETVTLTYAFDINVTASPSSPGSDFTGDFVVYVPAGGRRVLPDSACAAGTDDKANTVVCTLAASTDAGKDAKNAALAALEYDAVRDSTRTYPNYEAARAL